MMDSTTGKTYRTVQDAMIAGVKPENLVEISGPEKAIRRVAKKVQKQCARDAAKKAAKRMKMQKKSRKANKRKR
jgi:hypothetical protein